MCKTRTKKGREKEKLVWRHIKRNGRKEKMKEVERGENIHSKKKEINRESGRKETKNV